MWAVDVASNVFERLDEIKVYRPLAEVELSP
jgi:hypothetical protein